jgi:hypothetical protein
MLSSVFADAGIVRYAFVVTEAGGQGCTGEGFVQFASGNYGCVLLLLFAVCSYFVRMLLQPGDRSNDCPCFLIAPDLISLLYFVVVLCDILIMLQQRERL